MAQFPERRVPSERTPPSRRSLLKGVGLSGLALGFGAMPPLWGQKAQAVSTAATIGRVDPTELRFSIVERTRPFDLLASNFVQLRDGFASADSGDRFAVLGPGHEHNAGRVTFGGGATRFDGEAYFALLRSDTNQRAPFATVIVDVESFSGDGGPEDTIFAGLVKDEANHVLGWYNAATDTAGLDVTTGGSVVTLGTAHADIGAPCRVAFCLTSSTVVLLVDEGDGFRPLLQRRLDGYIDLRRPSLLAEYHNGFGARATSGEIACSSMAAGYYGQAGVRDPHVVTYADGTPYIRDNKVYLTFTQAGLAFFETAHWGVWTLDLDSYAVEQVGNLFFRREGMDAVLGDHAGHIVLDEDRGRWILAMSTWGDFTFDGVEVNYVTVPVSTDVLSGVHIFETSRLPLPAQELPTPAAGQWDPHLLHAGGRWYVAFVNARRFFDFYPALAQSAHDSDFTELSLAGADPSKNETEGPVMQKVGQRWYVLASNGDASPEEMRGRFPVYDLGMKQVGTLNAPHPTNIPWPMVFPVPLPRAQNRWVMVTFNGTQYHDDVLGYGTHGDLVIMEAKPVTDGYEFPPR